MQFSPFCGNYFENVLGHLSKMRAQKGVEFRAIITLNNKDLQSNRLHLSCNMLLIYFTS